jgi:hypothetical protein
MTPKLFTAEIAEIAERRQKKEKKLNRPFPSCYSFLCFSVPLSSLCGLCDLRG